jgi:hypothetical protein
MGVNRVGATGMLGERGGGDAWARGNTATGGQRHSSVAGEGDAKRLR